MKYWEIIADNLSKAGWIWGIVSAIDSNGRTTRIADAHRDDGKRFVVHADEKLTRFVEHSNWRFPLATIVLDAQARFSQNSTSLNGSESGGGFSPLVLRLFRTRNKQRSTHRGKREEDP